MGRVSHGLDLIAALVAEKRGGVAGYLGSVLAKVKKEEPRQEPVLG